MKIKASVTINSRKTIPQVPDAWSKIDTIALLEELGYTDNMSESEAEEMLLMALSDQEPEASATLLLNYKLSGSLSAGQIQQLSHEMQEDKVSEEYADIFLHRSLFDINQLLHKAYNGRFPKCNAVVIDINLTLKGHADIIEPDNLDEIIIKSLLPALDDHSVIQRLYDEVLEKEVDFPDARGIIWKSSVTNIAEHQWHIVFYSSEYWFRDLAKDASYETVILMADDDED